MKNGWYLLVLLLVMITPVTAEVINAYDVSSYSVAANPGNVIYQIIVDPIPMGINQSHVLVYNGATFLLTIGSNLSYGVYHEFDIALTYPNGTVDRQHRSTIRISSGNYKTTIQPVFPQAESLTNAYLIVDLEIGLVPVSAEFNTQPSDWSATSAIPFTSASGDLGGATTNVFIWQMTQADFKANVLNYNPAYGVTNLGATVFQWTWSAALGFINMIPVIGPAFLTMLDLAGTIVTELIWWLRWAFPRLLGIILGAEVLIMMFSVINAGTPISMQRLTRNLFKYNVMCFKGEFWIFEKSFHITSRIVEIIANIVQALKP